LSELLGLLPVWLEVVEVSDVTASGVGLTGTILKKEKYQLGTSIVYDGFKTTSTYLSYSDQHSSKFFGLPLNRILISILHYIPIRAQLKLESQSSILPLKSTSPSHHQVTDT